MLAARFRSGHLLVAAGLAWTPLGAQAPPADTDPEVAEALAVLQEGFRTRAGRPDDLKKLASLLNTSVVSASNRLEQLWGAPAHLIVLTREDLGQRGYRDLSGILDDLPGMDMARHYGDDNFKNYWRGYRNTQGDPYLVLVDGQNTNDLWLMQGQHTLAAFPLSAIERVEVLYGPTSVLYGANAMVGVINIVTTLNQAQDGMRFWGAVGAGDLGARTVDLTHFAKRGDLRVRLSVRASESVLDESGVDGYEYTKRAYLRDDRIWARGFLDAPDMRLQDPPTTRTQAVDLRVLSGATEFGALYERRESGYGVTYARDQIQSQGLWIQPALSVHLRHAQPLTDTLETTTTLRWREDGFTPRSWDLEAYYDPAQGTFLNRYSHWRTENRSFSLNQDFDWWINWRWSLNFGARWEDRNLQRGYDFNTGFNPIYEAVLSPELPPHTDPANRIQVRDWGLYLHARARLDDRHLLHLGVRQDHHPAFGTATNVRLGYTGRLGPFDTKLLFGEAFQEPSPRTLYGGFLQAGDNPNLQPEHARTWELELSQGAGPFLHSLDVYYANYRDTVTYLRNLGNRTVVGADYQAQVRFRPRGLDELRVWAFYSAYLRATGSPAGDFGLTADGHVGDLSRGKAWLEVRARRGPLQASVRGRYFSARPTPASNPVGAVPAQGTLDLTCSWSFGATALQAAVQNAFDRRYFHPGIYAADAGTVPGRFVQDPQGVTHWLGSGGAYDAARGFYNSLLPQPGRTFQLSLLLRP